jgi:hypothetical protein
VYLHVDIASAPAAVELRDRENFGELSIRITGAQDMDRLRATLAAWGRLDDDHHAYIQVDALRTLAGESARNADWRTAFDGMIAYARAHGWVDQGGAVRAHIETDVSSGPPIEGGRR